jgi:hypothetical protein
MTDNQTGSSSEPKRCFVVMGFGIKTDFATGRKLDLDKSYRLLIKPAVEEQGLVCRRADEIRHSGAIDVPMYQELLTADVVIADLSTANPNALYELGIRHALRPRTTVVISENKLPYPFDLNHILITSYTHLGDAIDYDEVISFRKRLGETLRTVLEQPRTDSPVYTFLSQLIPPSLREEYAAVARAGEAMERAGEAIAGAAADIRAASEPDPDDRTLSMLIEQGEQAIRDDRFSEAKTLFSLALQLCKQGSGEHLARDPYLVQRLVLATYKSRKPDEITALLEARQILSELAPEESNDPETVGLAGAIAKKLFEKGQGAENLNRSIGYYSRGYYLRNDRYNGINLAYLLNARTDTPLDATEEEKIADLVWANRIRREVLALTERELAEIRERRQRTSAGPDQLQEDQNRRDEEQEFWSLATKAEVHFGLGEIELFEKTRSEAQALKPPGWMMESLDHQIRNLGKLLEKHGHLLNPPWPGTGGSTEASRH